MPGCRETIDPFEPSEALVDLLRSIDTSAVLIASTVGVRRLQRDSEPVDTYSSGTYLIGIATHGTYGRSQLTDCVTRHEDIGPALRHMAHSALQAARHRRVRITARRDPLVLAPSVAAVLLHELIAHIAEDLPSGAPALCIGPPDLDVLAYHPRVGGIDDEGAPAGQTLLVEGGMLRRGVNGTNRAAQIGGEPDGLAQAAWHRAPPQARCTHLKVQASGRDRFEMPASGILCVATSGAELVGRTAYLGISIARRLGISGPSDYLAPFIVSVELHQLVNHLTAIDAATERSRGGICVKGNQALPTEILAPTLLLEGVETIESAV